MKKFLSRFTAILTAAMMLLSSMPTAFASGTITGGVDSIVLEDSSATYSITFDDQGTLTEKSVNAGDPLIASEWPEPAHLQEGLYRFDGWYENDAKVSTLEDVHADHTLTAKYVRQYTITYTNTIDAGWTNIAVKVDEGTHFVASDYFHETQPVHYDDSFRFSGWEPSEIASVNEDTFVDARYKQLKSYTITINYVFKESEQVAHDPYIATVLEGYELTDTIPSPTIRGFICDHPDGVTIAGKINEDKEVTVYYTPSGDTPYTVHYMQQQLDGTYSDIAMDTRTGRTGSLTQVTDADAQKYLQSGFHLVTDIGLINTTIAADSTTSIEIKYDRDIRYVIFDTANGTYIEPRSGMFGAAFTAPTDNPTRDGYRFVKWVWTTVDADGNTITLKKPVTTIQAQDVTVTAQWTVQKAWYTVVVWREDVTGGTFTALGTMRFQGKTDEAVTYKEDTFKDGEGKDIERYVDGKKHIPETQKYFTYDSTLTLEKNGGALPMINGDGSTLLNVYYKRDTFTVEFYINPGSGLRIDRRAVEGTYASITLRDGTVKEGVVSNDKPIHKISAKYEADIASQYPIDVFFENKLNSNRYNGWVPKVRSDANKGNFTDVTSTRCQMDTNLCDISPAHISRYVPQYTASSTKDDLYYLLERLDGDYESAGYDQTMMCSKNPGNITNGSTNKSFKGYSMDGHATYTLASGESEYPSIYSIGENGEKIFKVRSRGEQSITKNNLPSLLPGGTWIFFRDTNSSMPAGIPVNECNASFVWYTRIRSTLTFQNGGLSSNEDNIPFGTPLSQYKPENDPVRPAGIDDDYEFGGWYVDAGYTTEIDWNTATMPEGDYVLHARWIKPEYTVVFDFNDGESGTPDVTQYIEKNGTVRKSEIDKPTRDGYRFDYWYYVDTDGTNRPFIYSVRINRNYTLFAHWTAVAVQYTVNYVYTGDLYTKDDKGQFKQMTTLSKTVDGMVGDEKTEKALALYDANQNVLFPDALSSSITLKAKSEENVITFTYTRVKEVCYRVTFVDENNQPFAIADNGKVYWTDQAYITKDAVNISGYTPQYFQITWKLGVDTDPNKIVNNNIVFKYRLNPRGVYEVVYWLQNLDDNGYTRATTSEIHSDVSLGTVAHADQKTFAGYYYVPSISKASGTVFTSNDSSHLMLYMYYNRSYLPYGAHFRDIDTKDEISPDETKTARFGKTMPVVYKAINSYELVGKDTLDVEVKAADANGSYEENYRTFWYKQSDLSYAVRYLYDDGNGVITQIATPDQYTHADSTHRVKLGETYSQTLSKSSIEFGATNKQETFVHVPTDATTKSVKITKNDNFIDFYFTPLTYSITYDANGGSGAPADKTGIRAFTEVTLATDAPIAPNDEYTFVGWSLDSVDPVYETNTALGGVRIVTSMEMPKRNETVHAVWSHLNATLSYDANAKSFDGTLPQSQNAPLDTPITVNDGSSISRDGYTFAGWMRKDGNGNLVAPVYGQGEQMTPTIKIGVNTTLYAVWQPINYTIAFHLGAAASNLPAGTTWTHPNTVSSYNITSESITLLDASKDGYTFVDWFTDEACTKPAESIIMKGSTGNRDYYAKFAYIVPSLSLKGFTAVYDGETHSVTLDGEDTLLPTDTVAYSVDGKNVANAFVDAVKSATVTATVTRDGQTIWTDNAQISIAQRPITVTATSKTDLVFTGAEQETDTPKYEWTAYDADLNVGLLANHTLTADISGDKRTIAGSNAVTIGDVVILSTQGNVTKNYSITRNDGMIEIAQAVSSADDTATEHVYDNTAVGFTAPTLYAGKGRTRTEIPASEVTLRWKLTDQTVWNSGSMPTYTEVRSITGRNIDAYELDVELSHPDYQTQTVTAKLTIKPAPVTLTADTKDDFPYTVDANGDAIEWKITGASWQIEGLEKNTLYANDKLIYVLTGNTRSKRGKGSVGFESYAIEDASHAKNYAIQTVKGLIQVVDNKQPVTLTAQDQSFDYDATAHTMTSPTVSVAGQGDLTNVFALSYAVTDESNVTTNYSALPTFTDAGAYSVTISAHLDGYDDPAPAIVTVTVNKATLTLTSGSDNTEYTATAHSVNVLDSDSGLVSASHQITAALIKAGQFNSAVNVGDYEVEIDKDTVVVSDGANDVTKNYSITTVPGMLSITKAPLTVSAQSAIIAYDGNEHELSVTVGENQLKGDDKATLSIGKATEKGTYNLTPSATVMNNTIDVTSNYDISLNGGTLTIIDFTAQGVNTTYDGEAHAIAVTLPDGYTDYAVSYADANGNTVASSYIDAIDPTTVTVTLTPNDPTSGLPVLTHDVTVSIAPKEINLTVDRISKVYDGEGAQLSVSLPANAAVNAADEAEIIASVTLTNSAGTSYPGSQTFVNATNEHIVVSATAKNYTVNNAETDVVITARPVNVYYSDSPLNAVYDEQAHSLTPVAESENKTSLSGVLDASFGHYAVITPDANATQTDVTNGQIEAGFDSVVIRDANDQPVTANYAINPIRGRIEITQAASFELELVSYGEPYDGNAHEVTVKSVTDAAKRVIPLDRYDWTFNDAATLAQTDVGYTLVSVVGKSKNANNYPDVKGTASIDITKRPLTLTAGTSTGNVYDGQTVFSVDYASDGGEVAGQVIEATLINNDQINADSYSVTFDENATVVYADATKQLDVTKNYQISYRRGTIEIQRAASSTAPTSFDYTYDGTAKPFVEPKLTANGTDVTEPVVMRWRLPGETDWNDGQLPTYSEANSTLKQGGQANNPDDYTLHPYTVEIELSSSNYETQTTTATMTIQRKLLTIGTSDADFIFDGTPKSLTVETKGQVNGDVPSFNFLAGYLNSWTAVTVGVNDPTFLRNGHPVIIDDATVSVHSVNGDDVTSCYAIDKTVGVIRIARATAHTSPATQTLTYDGAAHDYALPVLLDAYNAPVTEAVTYLYRAASTDAWSKQPLTALNAGTTTIQIRMETASYNPVETTSTLTIDRLVVQVQAPSDDFTYMLDANGNPHVWTLDAAKAKLATGSNPLVTGHAFQATLDAATASRSDIGSNDVLLTDVKIFDSAAANANDVTSNYDVRFANGELTVSASTVPALIEATDLEQTYKASDYTLAQPVISVLSTDGVTRVDRFADFDVTYNVTSDTFDGEQVFTNELPHFTDAGTYNVVINATSAIFPEKPAAATVTMRINPAELVLTSGVDDTFVYNAAEHTVDPLLIKSGALMGNDAITDHTFAAGFGNGMTDVGSRDVQLESVTVSNANGTVNGNYAIKLEPGHITVAKLKVTGGLTIAGYDEVYDAQAHGVTLGDTLTTTAGSYQLSDPRFTVSYTAVSATEPTTTGATNPTFTNASTHAVTATVTDTTGNMEIEPISANVVIRPRTVTITADDLLAIPYDGLDHDAETYTAEVATTGDTGLLGSDTASATLDNTPERIVPNTYTVTVSNGSITSGVPGNYVFAYQPGRLEIVKGTGIGLSITADNGTYDGNAHGYTVTPTVPAGTPYGYRIYQNGAYVDIDEAAIPAYVNADSYPITLQIYSPYYEDTSDASATLVIRQRPLIVESGDNTSAPYTFTGDPQSVAAAQTAPSQTYGLVAGDDYDQASATFAVGSENVNTNACDRDVELTGVKIVRSTDDVTSNYALTYAKGHIVIRKAASATQPTTISYPFDGAAHTYAQPVLTATNAPTVPLTDVVYEYSADNGATWTAQPKAQIDVRRNANSGVIPYEIKVRMSHANYETQTTDAKLTITPAPITVKADERIYPYALDADNAPIVRKVDTARTTIGTLYEGADIEPTFSSNTRSSFGWQVVNLTDVRVMVGTVDRTSNYTVAREPGRLEITQGVDDVIIDADDASVTYDAEEHSIPAIRVLVKNNSGVYADMTDAFTVRYDVAYTAPNGDTDSKTNLKSISYTEAGTYAVTVRASATEFGTPADKSVTLTIRQRVATITSGDNSTAPYTFSGKSQQVDADVVYEGDAEATDMRVSNLVSGHKLANIVYEDNAGNANIDVTDRSVLVRSADVMNRRTDLSLNYRLQYVAGRIVINPLPIPTESIVIPDVENEYDGNEYGLTLPETIRTSAGTLRIADEFDVEYTHNGSTTSTNPTFINVGEYPVTVRLISRSGNYAAETVTATVRITPKPLTIAYGAVSETYDETEHTVDRTITGLVARDAINLKEQNRTATDVTRKADGTLGALTATATDYTIVASDDATVDRSANYAVSVQDGSIEIKPVQLTVTADTGSHVYNAAMQSVTTATVTGTPVTGHVVTYTLSDNTVKNVVNAKPVKVSGVVVTNAAGTDVTRNYEIIRNNGALTITPAPLTLGVTTVSIGYDGLPHTPDGFVVDGLQGKDYLASYQLLDMPRTEPGTYANVAFRQDSIQLRDKTDSADVTANYTLTFTTGSLAITRPTTTYNVEYYYDGVLGATNAYADRAGRTITFYEDRPQTGYTFDHAEGLPLTLVRNAASNVIRIYYTRVTIPELTTLTDADIPLAGNMASLNIGTAVE